jgi:hypothetical protein
MKAKCRRDVQGKVKHRYLESVSVEVKKVENLTQI